jgi:hypothetical protein
MFVLISRYRPVEGSELTPCRCMLCSVNNACIHWDLFLYHVFKLVFGYWPDECIELCYSHFTFVCYICFWACV